MANLKLSVFLAALCVLSCLANNNGDRMWEIFLPAKESTSSRFHVLHDWSVGGGVFDSDVSSPFPAAKASDIMLKTMGILREGANWQGVKLGNLFRRPRATAMFVVDGLPNSNKPLMSFEGEKTFSVDQSGLTGSITNDMYALFKGDNVVRYLDQLFNSKSITYSVSGDTALSRVIAPSAQPLPEPNLGTVRSKLTQALYDFSSPVDAAFAREVALVQSSIAQISHMKGKATDEAPDAYVFMFTTLSTMKAKYGDDSSQYVTAVSVVRQVIQEASKKLVEMYNGDIIVQALTLSWKYTEVSDGQVDALQAIFKRFNVPAEEMESSLADLPVVYPPSSIDTFHQESLCQDISQFIESEGGNMKADCVDELSWLQAQDEKSRLRRDLNDGYDADAGSGSLTGLPYLGNNNTRVSGVVEGRSNDFSAIFLIMFVVVVPLGLALFAVSWMMWNLDPGRDSIIYRSTEPSGLKMD